MNTTTELGRPNHDAGPLSNTYAKLIILAVVALFTGLFVTQYTASANTGEDGGVEQHEKFEFSAFISHDEIIDGVGLNSHMDKKGFDDAPDNGIVRTWDTISYPLRITVNPKGTGALENIELEITGTLDGGITDGRANARFAVDGTEDMASETVSFKQSYTIARTGNAVMFPVTVEVLAAEHGVKLTPDIQVQVVSVDGEDIRDDNIITSFDGLPTTEVTADVSIQPEVRPGLNALGIPSYPIQNVTGDAKDQQNLHMFTVAWGIANLPGTSSIKGSTFPDPDGEIDFDINLSGKVDWQSGPLQGGASQPLNFTDGDTAFRLFDHRDNSAVEQSVGSPNTVSDGKDYSFEHIRINNAPYSSMPDFDPETIERFEKGNVWDSGDWSVSKPKVNERSVSYSGTNTGYVIGSTFPDYSGYTQNRPRGQVTVADNLFASQNFLIQLENEYFVGGGKQNPGNHGNIVQYDAVVKLNGYTAPNGDTIDFNKSIKRTFEEVNSANGTFSFYNDFASYPAGEQLGTYVSNMGSLSKGDAYTLIGEDVQFRARLQSNVAFRGGVELMYHWNTDAFRLTEEYAERGERSIMNMGYEALTQEHIRNNTETQSVSYGVPKFDSNEFTKLRTVTLDDYTWYDTFKEAQDNGSVGAMLNSVNDAVGPSRYPQVNIPLRVLHNNIGIGSTSSDNPNDANIAVLSPYGYLDEAREIEVDIKENVTMGTPAVWNKQGIMEEKQSPTRGYSNFETLAIIPAEVSTKLSSERQTYFNSEAIGWKSESSVNLPGGALPSDFDSGVTIRHELPEGLDYVPDSGRVDGEVANPEIDDVEGERVLVWDVMISNEDSSIPDVEFETSINNKALDEGAQSSASIRSVIESSIDSRPEDFRESTHSVTITKVGMVGVREQVVPISGTGPKNSDYEVRVSPYTTIEDEPGIAGVKVLPYSDDPGGSKYTGNAEITSIATVIGSGSNLRRSDVDVYVNNDIVHTTKPHEIDFSTGGWRPYRGPADLDGVMSIGFKIEGSLAAQDDVTLRIKIATDGNDFGDTYANETVVNSARNHEESPVARVMYRIAPDLALRLDRFQIFTNKGSEGLPSFTRVHQIVGSHIDDTEALGDLEVTLGIYNSETDEKVTSKAFKQSDLENENEIVIPTSDLPKGDVTNYEVRVEAYDTDRVWVDDGHGAINTDGYVAEEDVKTAEDINADTGLITHDGVTMTERERGKDMVTFSEHLEIDPFDPVRTKSGYGFDLSGGAVFNSVLMDRIADVIPAVNTDTDASAVLDRGLVDKSLEFYDESEDRNAIPLTRTEPEHPEVEDADEPEANTVSVGYGLPEVYMENNSGLTYTAAQVEADADMSPSTMLSGGNQLFVPVWIDTIGLYDASLVSDQAIGSHFTTFNVGTEIDVYAYMLHHIDSGTGDDDELLLKPVEREELPDFWQTDEDGNPVSE